MRGDPIDETRLTRARNPRRDGIAQYNPLRIYELVRVQERTRPITNSRGIRARHVSRATHARGQKREERVRESAPRNLARQFIQNRVFYKYWQYDFERRTASRAIVVMPCDE